MPPILDKPVLIGIAVFVDPIRRQFDVRPQRLDEFQVASPPVISARQHQKQRRGIDAAIVSAERNFTRGGHFPFAGFVQDLSRLGIPLGREFLGLRSRQVREHPPRDFRVHP